MQKYFYVYVQKMFCQKEKFAVFFLPDDDLICQKLGKYLAKKNKTHAKNKMHAHHKTHLNTMKVYCTQPPQFC